MRKWRPNTAGEWLAYIVALGLGSIVLAITFICSKLVSLFNRIAE